MEHFKLFNSFDFVEPAGFGTLKHDVMTESTQKSQMLFALMINFNLWWLINIVNSIYALLLLSSFNTLVDCAFTIFISLSDDTLVSLLCNLLIIRCDFWINVLFSMQLVMLIFLLSSRDDVAWDFLARLLDRFLDCLFPASFSLFLFYKSYCCLPFLLQFNDHMMGLLLQSSKHDLLDALTICEVQFFFLQMPNHYMQICISFYHASSFFHRNIHQ